MTLSPALYIIATPIGNLGDFSPRAQEILKELDLIACEDTRRTRALLTHFGITQKRLLSIHDEKESTLSDLLLNKIALEGQAIGLVCDSGTPCISDPGFGLVHKAQRQKVPVIPVPGPCAVTALLSASGLPPLPFLAIGFLPIKTSNLIETISQWQNLRPVTIIFYESPKRILGALEHIARIYPDAQIAVGRELTKLYEEILFGTPQEICEIFSQKESIKGELAVALHLHSAEENSLSLDFEQKKLISALKNVADEERISPRSLKKIAKIFGLPKESFYGESRK